MQTRTDEENDEEGTFAGEDEASVLFDAEKRLRFF